SIGGFRNRRIARLNFLDCLSWRHSRRISRPGILCNSRCARRNRRLGARRRREFGVIKSATRSRVGVESVTRAVDRIVDVDSLLLLISSAHLVCPLAACAPLAIAIDTSLESLNYAGSVLQSLNRFGDDIGRKRRACDQTVVETLFLREELESAVAALPSAVGRSGGVRRAAIRATSGNENRIKHCGEYNGITLLPVLRYYAGDAVSDKRQRANG